MNLKVFFGLIIMLISTSYYALAGNFGEVISQEEIERLVMRSLFSLEKTLRELQEEKSRRLHELGVSEFDENLLNFDEKLSRIHNNIKNCVEMKKTNVKLKEILRKEPKAKL